LVVECGARDAGTVSATYDPFAPGPLPVRARTLRSYDAARDREFACELWHSAQSATDAPVVLYSHHSFGDRNSATYLCEHLAGHGFVVAALDHSERSAPQPASADETPQQRAERVHRIVADRVPDLRLLLDSALDRPGIDPSGVGVVGHSFGGWTALSAADSDERIDSIVAITPGGSATPRPGVLDAPLYPRRAVPTVFIAAEHDVPIPPDDVRDVFARTPGATMLVTVRNADHLHFVGDAETAHEQMRTTPIDGPASWMPSAMKPFAELCPAQVVHDLTRALTLAHLDATLRADEGAVRFLADDLVAALAARDIGADIEMAGR
jgi:predicted dienelactone hydrolase